MQAGEQQPLLAEVGVIGEGTPTLFPPVAHEEGVAVEGVETLLEEIATSTVTEIRTDVRPQGVIHHLTEEAAGVAGVANGRHRVRDQGAHRDAGDLATIDTVYLYIHCSSSYRLQPHCSTRQNYVEDLINFSAVCTYMSLATDRLLNITTLRMSLCAVSHKSPTNNISTSYLPHAHGPILIISCVGASGFKLLVFL